MHEPLAQDAAREGARLAFGRPVEARYQLDRADVIVSLDCDFLSALPGSVRYARDFAKRRTPEHMARLYAAETLRTISGAMADERQALAPQRIVVEKDGRWALPLEAPKVMKAADVIAKGGARRAGTPLARRISWRIPAATRC